MHSRLCSRLWCIVRRFATVSGQLPTLSPAVRALVDKNHLDPSKITPSGPGGRILKGDVIHYLEQGGSHDVAAPPTTAMIKWCTPPTAGEMWGVWSGETVPRGFVYSHTKLEHKVADGQLDSMVVKATILASKNQPQVNVKWNSQQMISVPQDSFNLSFAMATGELLMTSVISGDPITSDRSLEDVTALLTRSQQQSQTDILQSNPPSICVCTRPGHLSVVDLSSHLVPMASLLLVTRQQAGDHMISTTVSHDLRVINQSQAEQWLQKFLTFLHH